MSVEITAALRPPSSFTSPKCLLFSTPCGQCVQHHINRLQSAVEVETEVHLDHRFIDRFIHRLYKSRSRPEAKGTQLCAGNMTSLTWRLLCFICLLVPGTVGTSTQFGSRSRQIHSIRPSIPRVSSQVSPRVHQRFEEIKSIEPRFEEDPTAESFLEVQQPGAQSARGSQQQQGARAGANSYLQERQGADNGGGLVL